MTTLKSIVGFLVLSLAITAAAQNYPAMPPQELVARAVQGQLDSFHNAPPYMYKSRRQTPNVITTKQIIETREGLISRVIAYADRPLTPNERAGDDARLQRLVTDRKAMEEKRKEQQQDAQRVLNMYREIPNAFVFRYDGIEAINGRETVRLKFFPKDSYSPAFREAIPFKAMQGTIWIDKRDQRLVKIDALMTRDVTIGWGLLGRIYKGGTLQIEQAPVGEDRWDPTFVNLNMSGKALFFKTINLKQTERFWDFKRVPQGLTVAQGVELLRKADVPSGPTIAKSRR